MIRPVISLHLQINRNIYSSHGANYKNLCLLYSKKPTASKTPGSTSNPPFRLVAGCIVIHPSKYKMPRKRILHANQSNLNVMDPKTSLYPFSLTPTFDTKMRDGQHYLHYRWYQIVQFDPSFAQTLESILAKVLMYIGNGAHDKH
jgi:hypothetical protein